MLGFLINEADIYESEAWVESAQIEVLEHWQDFRSHLER
jgi:hypothetical protein